MKKTWKGRFKKKLDADADKFNASIGVDSRLFAADVKAGMAHAKALLKAKVLTKAEAKSILAGLAAVLRKKDGVNLASYEDVHSAVEYELVKKTGEKGKKLHTGRSRNDRVATETRIYLKEEIAEIKKLLKGLMAVTVKGAEKNAGLFMPGYTHLQHAQVVPCGQWLMAYYEMFKRDLELLSFAAKRADVMPLGSGALAGGNYPVDRNLMARELKFAAISANSMDAVSDRDFALDFLYAASMTAMHLSRMAEEIIIYTTQEFAFLTLDDAFSTGSSLMPHKKNPDLAELARGKAGVFFGSLITLLAIMKGLPLAYNKDMQEDKAAIFRAIDELKIMLKVFAKFTASLKFNKTGLEKQLADTYMYAVDVADYLVKKGVAFRDSHEITGRLVSYCVAGKKQFDTLSLSELKKFSTLFERDVFTLLEPGKSAAGRPASGAASVKEVKKQVKAAKNFLKNEG